MAVLSRILKIASLVRLFSNAEKKIENGFVLAPGIYDALTGLIAEQSGAEAVYLSGASIAYTRFGRSDIGLVSVSEVHDTLAAITDRIEIPVIVDADTGFGNALNVQRTVRQFERAGASAIQLEDQSFPKRCGHLDGKTLVPMQEMVGKIKAALDARHDHSTLIVARTDARAVEGLDAAMERAASYRDAGADILFVEAPQSREEMHLIADKFGKDIPLLANMVEGGKTPSHQPRTLLFLDIISRFSRAVQCGQFRITFKIIIKAFCVMVIIRLLLKKCTILMVLIKLSVRPSC